MKVNKKVFQSGANPAILEIQFQQRMKKAMELEDKLEAQTFEHECDTFKVIISGKPYFKEITIKKNCDPDQLLEVFNGLLSKVHVFRDGMAKSLLEAK